MSHIFPKLSLVTLKSVDIKTHLDIKAPPISLMAIEEQNNI